MDFQYIVYFVRLMGETRHDFEKLFGVSRKGIKHEAFPIKILAFKIIFLLFSKITIFAKFSKNHIF